MTEVRERNVKWLSILILPLIISFVVINVGGSPGTTTMFVDPPAIIDETLQAPSTFDVRVNISTTELLYTWQFNMSWDPSILTWYNIVFGDFLAGQPGGTIYNGRVEAGWCMFSEASQGDIPGVAGSGWLANITFQVVGSGDTVIDIDHDSTYIWATNPTPPPSLIKIYPVTENGYFSNIGIELPGDADGDGDVDYDDLVILADAYGSSSGQPAYDERADFDDDDDVDCDDLVTFAKNYGKSV